MPRKRDQERLRNVGQRVAQARRDRGWTACGSSEVPTIDTTDVGMDVLTDVRTGGQPNTIANAPGCKERDKHEVASPDIISTDCLALS